MESQDSGRSGKRSKRKLHKGRKLFIKPSRSFEWLPNEAVFTVQNPRRPKSKKGSKKHKLEGTPKTQSKRSKFFTVRKLKDQMNSDLKADLGVCAGIDNYRS